MPIGVVGRTDSWSNPESEKHRDRYYGVYLGFVKDRDDPTMTGRVRVWVPAILPDGDGEEGWLDWARPSSSGLAVPPVGATVIVQFEHGIVTHPVYHAGWLRGDSQASSEAPVAGKETKDPTWLPASSYKSGGVGPGVSVTVPADEAATDNPVYPFNKVYESENGHILEVDDTPGANRVRYRHPSGTTIHIDSGGNVRIVSTGAQIFEPGGDMGVLLKDGAEFKVVYAGGGALSVGASGVHVSGQACSVLGRTVLRSPDPIK